MATSYRRPLLVVHSVGSGHSVLDIGVMDEQTLEVDPSLDSVVEQPLQYRPLAIAAGTILGVTPRPRHLLVHPWTNALISEIQDPRDTGPPIMLTVGEEGTVVIRMDTIIYGDDPSASRFEALRFVPSTGGWHIVPLPRPPLGALSPFERVAISAYFVMGTRVWVSVTGKGTFSLDAEQGTWRAEFPEELQRLHVRALFVPELDAVVGLTPGEGRLLCAYRFNDKGILSWQRTWTETLPWECFYNTKTQPTMDQMVDLAYLGNGRFCVCRPVKLLGSDGTNMNSFLVLELRRLRDGELQLLKRGTLCLQSLWSQETCQGLYFLP